MMSGISGMSSMMETMRPSRQEMFNRMDSDGNAAIDKDELSSALEEMTEKTGIEIDVEELVAAHDEDGDGALDEAETHATMESLREQMGPPPQGPPPESQGAGLYEADGSERQSVVDQLLGALSESEDEEEEDSLIQSWIQALKGENQSYTPIDTQA